MTHTFRDYEERDYMAVLSLVSEELEAAGEKMGKNEVERLFREHLDFEHDTIRIMATDKGKLIGWYRYGPWPRGEDDPGETVHLFDIALKKKFRGKGLGRALYKHFEDEVRAKGFTRIYSNTLVGNKHAQAFHEKMGFAKRRSEGQNILWVKGIV